ncbi:hypothetical protein ISF_03074 [Cordyceps fumosorosea ARSEF 2679]|uniref:Uncharacterized protein n=1 Tax=Cordyceps fumosorosea (strain ARSEF 2679) TaxID=1081104 RepID=A0A162LF87_CORFA|nr:hypothetical protein ISF_03074 [Cordyceps fumosorosea ARSEF 2679]OAA69804.1 hypothetical protein ISF_03074 [Cordyceps fumosorosea ARSEF 2679]
MTLPELVLRFHNWRHGVAKHQATVRKTDRPLRAGALSAASINWMALFDPVASHPDIVLHAVAARSLTRAQAQIDQYRLGPDVLACGSYEAMRAKLSIQPSPTSARAVECSLRCDRRQPKPWGVVPKIRFDTFVGAHVGHSIVVRRKDEQGRWTGQEETVRRYEGGELEAFVRVVRAADAGDREAAERFRPWCGLEESRAVIAVVDAIYDKAGLPRR